MTPRPTIRMTRRLLIAATALCALLTTTACNVEPTTTAAGAEATSAAPKVLKVGWSTIYLAPSWMQQTLKMLEDDVATLKTAGKVASYETFNANGDTSQQIVERLGRQQQRRQLCRGAVPARTFCHVPVPQPSVQGGRAGPAPHRPIGRTGSRGGRNLG